MIMFDSKRILLLLAASVLACGGSSKPPPQLISNTTSSTSTTTPSTEEPARVVWQVSSGGVIQLSGDRTRAMAAAEKMMATHCGGADAYTITQEGEEALHADKSGGPPKTATAWRVHYRCQKLIDI